MDVKDIIKKLEDSSEFKKWKKDRKTSYLAHIFKMIDEANKDDFQVGFYNQGDTISTFIIGKGKINLVPDSEIFKKPGSKVMGLDLEGIKIGLSDAIAKARKFKEEKYGKEDAVKEFVILQNLDVGQVYNITFVTRSFNTLNIKIDSKSGKVVEHKLMSLMDFNAG